MLYGAVPFNFRVYVRALGAYTGRAFSGQGTVAGGCMLWVLLWLYLY